MTPPKNRARSRARGAGSPPASHAERYAAGKALRASCPRESHAGWKAPASRRDAVELVLEAEKGRVPDLLPLRHGRMVRSAFTFDRGAALTMAADLASTPTSGFRVQCCGDGHLCNFGGFATPERRVVFSINDLDETLPEPWEWDLKRLAASFVVACRDNGLKDSGARDVAATCVRSYRESMAEFSQLKTLELWYTSLSAEELIAGLPADLRKRGIKRIREEQSKSRGEEMLPKLVEHKGDKPVIKDQLPTIFHAEDTPPGDVQKIVLDAIAAYRATLPTAYQSLLDRYQLRDAAIKVVGVGSVGTACLVLLFMAGEDDPLFLQVKEARASVLEPYAGPSVFHNHGQRIVHGYRLMQPEDPRALARPIRVPCDAQRLHGQERRPGRGRRKVLDRLRRPEREGPRRARARRAQRQGEGGLRRREVTDAEPRLVADRIDGGRKGGSSQFQLGTNFGF
jgi:uncharacterized protein (DUF2252 family)